MFHVPAHKNTTNPPAQIVGAAFKEHTTQRMTDIDAIMLIEGDDGETTDEETIKAAWQHLVDTGTVWKLHGWYGCTAQRLIDAGIIDHSPVAA